MYIVEFISSFQVLHYDKCFNYQKNLWWLYIFWDIKTNFAIWLITNDRYLRILKNVCDKNFAMCEAKEEEIKHLNIDSETY